LRRAIVALLSTAAGTSLLVGLKAGLVTSPASTVLADSGSSPTPGAGPEGTAPGGPGPDGTGPNSAGPGGTDPGGAGPAGADPGGTGAGAATQGGTAQGGTAQGAATQGGTAPGGTAPGGKSAPPAVAPAALRDGAFTGSLVTSKYGQVQVRITVAGGRLTEVAALRLPDGDGMSVQISKRAGAELREEALVAQSAAIQTVSGATYTSAAYTKSLQAALDAAKRV